jgi:hypothetical protein
MLIRTINDIIEVLNDDVLFIVKIDNNMDQDWISVFLLQRNGQKLYGMMTQHSLDLYSKFIMNEEKWNLLKSNLSFSHK